MQEATQLQLSPDGQSFYQPQSVSNIQDRARTLSPQPQHEPLVSRETLLQQHDKDKMVSRHIPDRRRRLVLKRRQASWMAFAAIIWEISFCRSW